MRRLVTFSFFAVLSVPAPRELSGQVDPTAAVQSREIAFARTMADHDLDAFLTFVAPEAVFFNEHEALRGRDVIADAWAPFCRFNSIWRKDPDGQWRVVFDKGS